MLTMRGSALLIAVTASALGSPDCDTFTTCAAQPVGRIHQWQIRGRNAPYIPT